MIGQLDHIHNIGNVWHLSGEPSIRIWKYVCAWGYGHGVALDMDYVCMHDVIMCLKVDHQMHKYNVATHAYSILGGRSMNTS